MAMIIATGIAGHSNPAAFRGLVEAATLRRRAYRRAAKEAPEHAARYGEGWLKRVLRDIHARRFA